MIASNRLGAAAAVATLGISLAGPGIAGAVAAASVPTLPASGQLTSALETLVPTSSATSLASELAALQSDPTTGTLGSLDSTLNGLLGTLNGLLGGLLGSTPLAQTLESTLSATSALLPSGASAAQTQALAELNAALTTAGLSSLLAGLSSDDGAAALSQLAALQSLTPGASTAAGGLTSVGAIVAKLATAAGSGSDASTLTSAAALLDSGSALTPTQLLSAVADLKSVTSTAASGTSGADVAQIAGALASQLAQSGSLFGGLAGVGSSVSALDDAGAISTAATQLTAMATETPGATTGDSGLGPILTALSQANGIAGTPTGAELSTLASDFSNEDGVVYQDLVDGFGELQSDSAGLPAPLNTLVGDLAGSILGSGDFFGNLGLSSANQATALTEMSQLSALGEGATIPALPGLGAVLDALAAQSPITGTSTAPLLSELGSAISTTAISSTALGDIAEVVDNVAALLPAGLGTTVANLGAKLTSVATTVAGTPSSTGTSTGTSSSTATSSTAGSSTTTTKSTSSTASAAARRYDWGLARKVSRTHNSVTVTLYCFASAGLKCTDTLKATETGFHALTRKVTMNAGKTDRFTLKLKQISQRHARRAAKAKAAKRKAIKVTVVSGAYKVAKTLK
jgi:hypothetical protein